MTAGLGELEADAIPGTAAGVPYIALPPVSLKGGPAPMIALWHPLGEAGSPEAMSAVLPLRGVHAWRVYFALPKPAGPDLLLDIYAPMIEQAAAGFAAARAELRASLPIDNGPVAVVGSSAGGHAALRVLTAGQVPVAAAALINPGVRAESVVAVNERFAGSGYTWTEPARQRAAGLDMIAAAAGVRAPVLLVVGENEYPEFRPDQAALNAGLGGPATRITIPGMDHALAGDAARLTDQAITDWLIEHFE
jgi:pimeloyl-ACP methyl ester carboxylesterase